MKVVIREVIITILLALVIFMAIRTSVHNFEVNGYSMQPTMEDGQYVIVSKITYWFEDPQRGDIVVFGANRLNNDVIHRIIGLPGETVEIENGEVYIDGVKLDEPYIGDNQRSESPGLIPEDHYFIVGDNRRGSSSDIVYKDDIIGKAWLCYWPFSDWGLVDNHSW